MTEYTDAQRLEFAATGWPRPIGEDRCQCTTREGERCRRRRYQWALYCDQHRKVEVKP